MKGTSWSDLDRYFSRPKHTSWDINIIFLGYGLFTIICTIVYSRIDEWFLENVTLNVTHGSPHGPGADSIVECFTAVPPGGAH